MPHCYGRVQEKHLRTEKQNTYLIQNHFLKLLSLILSRIWQKHGLSKKKQRDADIWRRVGITFYKKWEGNPCNLLEHFEWDSVSILKHLKDNKFEYPYLRGDKIGPLWMRMLRDNVGIARLRNLEKVPIPVDRHVARATLATGVVRGQFRGRLDEVFEYIRKAWFESVNGLRVKNRAMIALDVDEPLWHLSKYGCTKRDKTTGYCSVYDRCEAKEFCIKGKVKIEEIEKKEIIVELET